MKLSTKPLLHFARNSDPPDSLMKTCKCTQVTVLTSFIPQTGERGKSLQLFRH